MRIKNGREYKTYTDKRAYIVEVLFYTDDGQGRDVSPIYTVDDVLMPDILDTLWDCFYSNTTPEEAGIKTSPYQTINVGVSGLNEKIDGERNKKLEELEKLPKVLYFEYESPFASYTPREEQ